MLFTLMTLSAQAQWFNFSENNNRAVVGINTGLVGYRNVSDLGSAETWDFADVGVGASIAIAGVLQKLCVHHPYDRMESRHHGLHRGQQHRY